MIESKKKELIQKFPVLGKEKDIIFGLPPLLSSLILNLWKLVIVAKIITSLIFELRQYDAHMNALILWVAYLELLSLIFRKINILDIILDIQQIFVELFRGPLKALKWSFIIIVFMIFEMVPRDNFMLSVVAFSMIIGFISFLTMLGKVGSNSGLFQPKIESGTALLPEILNEVKHIEPNEVRQNFYSATEEFSIKKKTKVIQFKKNTIIFKIPLSKKLENKSGVYVATMLPKTKKKSKLKARKTKNSAINEIKIEIIDGIKQEDIVMGEKIEKSLSNVNVSLNVKSVRQYSFDEWHLIQSHSVPLHSEEIITRLGFKNQDEFDQKVQKGLVGIIKVQDQIRARVRGLPVVTGEPNKYTIVWQGESHLTIPKEIINQMSKKGASLVEIIPGKEEYLFYVKMR